MKEKVNILTKKMKELDKRLFVGYTFVEYDDNCIALKFIDDSKGDWYLGKYYFDDNSFEKISKGIAPDLYDELEKYFDNFKELCKELFEGGDKMEEEKNIEVTNLDELQELLSDSKKLLCKLQSKIDEINNWKPNLIEMLKEDNDLEDTYTSIEFDHKNKKSWLIDEEMSKKLKFKYIVNIVDKNGKSIL